MGIRQPGDVEIASVQFFGRWRVQVFRLASTDSDQENTLTGIPADNWRELEADASALLRESYGTIEMHAGLWCPPELAQRAQWDQWAQMNHPDRLARWAMRETSEGKGK